MNYEKSRKKVRTVIFASKGAYEAMGRTLSVEGDLCFERSFFFFEHNASHTHIQVKGE